MEPGKAFGQALRKRRLAAGLTQEKLGFDAELERVFISWLENGRKQPTFQTMIKLARALGCTAAELVTDAERLLDNKMENRVDSLCKHPPVPANQPEGPDD